MTMTDSATGSLAASEKSEVKSTRLDPPHDLMLANRGDEPTPPWMAIAGLDPAASGDQLDRQTNELLAYVQQQNDEIDQRQEELNAKLAQLDNELRTARLRTARDAGMELAIDSSVANRSAVDAGMALDGMTESDEEGIGMAAMQEPEKPGKHSNRNKPAVDGEFEEVEELVAQFSGDVPSSSDKSKTSSKPESKSNPDEESGVAAVDVTGKPQEQKSTRRTADMPAATRATPMQSDQKSFRVDRAHQHATQLPGDVVPLADAFDGPSPSDLDLELQAMASSLDASELESERRMLAERKNELDRRQSTLQRMQSDTQAMHREALEMRLVTEQLWVEISDQAAPEHVQELLNQLRARLDEHYAEQQLGIDSQASELVTLKDTIEQKQEELRSQSAQLQQWVEDRHDEIKTYAAEVDARELLLDRREHRMHEEFSKWEATRNAYQKQLQGILKNLDH